MERLARFSHNKYNKQQVRACRAMLWINPKIISFPRFARTILKPRLKSLSLVFLLLQHCEETIALKLLKSNGISTFFFFLSFQVRICSEKLNSKLYIRWRYLHHAPTNARANNFNSHIVSYFFLNIRGILRQYREQDWCLRISLLYSVLEPATFGQFYRSTSELKKAITATIFSY